MEVCFWGLGSIGQRHLRNLRRVCIEQNLKLSVDAFRSSNTPLSEDIDKLVDKAYMLRKTLKMNTILSLLLILQFVIMRR